MNVCLPAARIYPVGRAAGAHDQLCSLCRTVPDESKARTVPFVVLRAGAVLSEDAVNRFALDNPRRIASTRVAFLADLPLSKPARVDRNALRQNRPRTLVGVRATRLKAAPGKTPESGSDLRAWRPRFDPLWCRFSDPVAAAAKFGAREATALNYTIFSPPRHAHKCRSVHHGDRLGSNIAALGAE